MKKLKDIPEFNLAEAADIREITLTQDYDIGEYKMVHFVTVMIGSRRLDLAFNNKPEAIGVMRELLDKVSE